MTTTADPRPPRSGPSRLRTVIDRLVVTVCMLVAVAVSVYPLVAMYVNDRNAYDAALEVADTQVQQAAANPGSTQSLLDGAHAYNEALPPGRLRDPILANDPATSLEYQEYAATMGGSEAAIGTLIIPDIESTMPIMHGTSEEVLNKGVGHMYGTHLPVGGEGTHSVLSAHRALPHLSAFDRLPELEIGDVFFVKTLGQTLAYEVNDINIVLPNELDLVTPRAGEDLITLVTCTPYAVNTHRLLVTAERVPFEDVPSYVQAAAENPPFGWVLPPGSTPRLAVAGLALLVLTALSARWLTQDLVLPLVRRVRRNKSLAQSSKEHDMTTRPAYLPEGSVST